MDLRTNAAGTKEWIRATQSMGISAFDPSSLQSLTSSSPAEPARQPAQPDAKPPARPNR